MPVSEDGQSITVCPHTRVTLTCTATQIISLTWADQSGAIVTLALNLLNTSLDRPPYNITLMAENAIGLRADFISTLEVIVDDIDSGTTITCRISQSEVKQLIITSSGLNKKFMCTGNARDVGGGDAHALYDYLKRSASHGRCLMSSGLAI